MSLQILKDKCIEKLNKLGLDSPKYFERLDREFKIFEDQSSDYINDLFDYFKKCTEYSKTNGKVKNEPHLLVLFILGATGLLMDKGMLSFRQWWCPWFDRDR